MGDSDAGHSVLNRYCAQQAPKVIRAWVGIIGGMRSTCCNKHPFS